MKRLLGFMQSNIGNVPSTSNPRGLKVSSEFNDGCPETPTSQICPNLEVQNACSLGYVNLRTFLSYIASLIYWLQNNIKRFRNSDIFAKIEGNF